MGEASGNRIRAVVAALAVAALSASGAMAAAGGVPATGGPRLVPADAGSTLVLRVGQSFLVDLGGSAAAWRIGVSDGQVVTRVPNITVVRGAQGVYRAVRPGQARLTAAAAGRAPLRFWIRVDPTTGTPVSLVQGTVRAVLPKAVVLQTPPFAPPCATRICPMIMIAAMPIRVDLAGALFDTVIGQPASMPTFTVGERLVVAGTFVPPAPGTTPLTRTLLADVVSVSSPTGCMAACPAERAPGAAARAGAGAVLSRSAG